MLQYPLKRPISKTVLLSIVSVLLVASAACAAVACGPTSRATEASRDTKAEGSAGREQDAASAPSRGAEDDIYEAGARTQSDAGARTQSDAGARTQSDAGARAQSDDADAIASAVVRTHSGVGDAGSASDASVVDIVCHEPGARFATGSPTHAFGPGQNNGQDQFPGPVLGPPKGGAPCSGSTDVVSLGNGGWVVLEFAGNAIVDGPGPDFIVFENPFAIACDPTQIFAELATVAVSNDGVTWKEFPCTATVPPYGFCSGWHVVNANADTNDIDPTNPAVAGGDSYDLADVGVASARYVRVTDRVDITGSAGVYDLDAVSIVHAACP
jgi:hypothetical protein